MGILKDIWRVGVLRCSVESVLAAGAIPDGPVTWLPNPGPLAYYADPFGIWRDGKLYVFVERFEYSDRRGAIDVFTLDDKMQILDRRPALAEPWHLSYPQVFDHDGDTFLLPEAFQSGRLTLYRAKAFPCNWEVAASFELDAVPIDATLFHWEGRWWLFYSPDHPEAAKTRALHVAFADHLFGPWRTHPGNPVRYDVTSARPGGAVTIMNGAPVLPVQDCAVTYGGGLRPLTIDRLTPDEFAATAGAELRKPAAWRPFYCLHTLSGAGDVTFIDTKRQIVTADSLRLDFRRQVGRLATNFAASFEPRRA